MTAPTPQQPAPTHVVHIQSAQKSPGIAVLLTILWMGAGHLYANRIATGIILMVFDAFLALFSLVPFAFLITVPIWFCTVPFACYFAAQATKDPQSPGVANFS